LSRTVRITLAVLIALTALFVFARLRYAGKALVKLAAENCDPGLWKHVHDKERLEIVEACTAVEGRVVSLHPASDGDLHIALDPEHQSILNLMNVMHAGGKLVVEVICEHTPADAANKDACGAFHPQIRIPNAGDRVRVTGAYVTDRDRGWNEIHPVTRIDILR